MNDYLNNSSILINSQTPRRIVSFRTILIVTFITFIIIGNYYKYPRYLNYRGNIIKEDNKYLIKTLIKEDDLLKLKKSNLIIEKESLDFTINYIDPIYYLDQQQQKHYEITLNSLLPKEFKQENMPILVKFKLSKTTLVKELIKKIKKGMI